MAAKPIDTIALTSPCKVLLRVAGVVSMVVTLPAGHPFIIVHDPSITNDYNYRVKTRFAGATWYLQSGAYDVLHLQPLYNGTTARHISEQSARQLLTRLHEPNRMFLQEGTALFCRPINLKTAALLPYFQELNHA